MPYVLLVLAVAAEVVGTSLLRATEGFTRLWPSLGVLASYSVAFVLLARVVQALPVGVTYALWAGLGTAAIVVIGVTLLGDPVSVPMVAGLLLVVSGVVVLNLAVPQ